ncbi:Gmad2 immunoglobulin-like domain-containing protein [Bacillus sp. BHET2]|uniref:Gmad2 immunoglobulin-like domain-containing protein n=1 Tax=Bacillus sp. BHET2 TaxID=2583818 RepID=UPI0014873229|nr:Gmad2 immunoglobulin-like domain-containing protein [Bacillus sp. BHET2]
MKKIVSILSILTVVVGMVACSQQPLEKTSVTEQKNDIHRNKEDIKTNNDQESKKENIRSQNESVSDVPVDIVYQNEAFKDVVVTQSGDEISVTGKARVFEGVFQYALYSGEEVLKQTNYQTDGAPAWGEFTITFKNDFVSTNEVKMELFNYSAKDGSKINTLEIPILK